jgi:CO/xanthine dehydrogenase FAD-binding subunit
MLLNLLEYHWAEDIDDALLLLARTDPKTIPLAGGTYILGLSDDTIQSVVDLRDLQLAYITEDASGSGAIHIGAMTTLQSIADNPLLKDLAGGLLSRAALASSFSRLIRNSATLGGTLGSGVGSQADLLTALAVLDVEVVVRSASKTQVNLSGGTADHPGLPLSSVTYKGKHERRVAFNGNHPLTSLNTARLPNELIIEVVIPRPSYNSGASFMRIGRTPTDIALVNVAAFVEVVGGIYKQVRLAVGGVNMEPQRLQAVEQQLEGQPVASIDQSGVASNVLDTKRLLTALQTGMANFQPPSDFRASSDYRRVGGGNLAFHALEEAANIARWRSMVSSEGRA